MLNEEQVVMVRNDFKKSHPDLSDDIDKLLEIENDSEYYESLKLLFKKSRTDPSGFPRRFFRVLSTAEVFARKESDTQTVLEVFFENLKMHVPLKTEMFLELDDTLKETLKYMKKSKIRFRDYLITEFKSEFTIETPEEVASFREALFLLTQKYSNFRQLKPSEFRLHNPYLKFLEETNEENRIKYKVSSNTPFFLKEGFFNEQDKNIKSFLEEAEKVPISQDMILIPFIYKKRDYYLTILNLNEQITLESINTGFKHINSQSNLYNQVRSAISNKFRENFEEFIHFLLLNLQKASGKNSKLLKNTYKNPKQLFKSKYIRIIQKGENDPGFIFLGENN